MYRRKIQSGLLLVDDVRTTLHQNPSVFLEDAWLYLQQLILCIMTNELERIWNKTGVSQVDIHSRQSS
jgi:hypothetical protein